MRRVSGYLTVYVALTLTVMLSLCLTLIEGVRRHTVAFETECVMDIGMDSVLAEYHRVLLQRYGILMIDTSYGTDYPSYYNTQQHLEEYLTRNLSGGEEVLLPFLYRDLLGMELEDVKVTRVSLATDDGGRAFQRRAAQSMKNSLGLNIVEDLLEWMEIVEGNGLLEGDLEEQLEQVSAQLDQYQGMEKQIGEETWIKIEITDPTETVRKMRKEGVLKWVVEDVSRLSQTAVDPALYISGRTARGEVNHGSYPRQEPLGLADNVLLLEYFLDHAGRYGAPLEDSLLQYQVEYLLCGNGSDMDNLRQTANLLCGIREAANVVYLLGCETKKGEVQALASLLASAIALPELEPLFETALILAWAYLESLYDVRTLLAGGRVALLKEDADWHYSLENIWNASVETQGGKKEGLSYEDYLRVLLYVQSPDTLTLRFMDLVEMDIRRTPGNRCFRMDGCIDGLEAEAAVRSGYGYCFTVRREKQY
ncbi:MAG: hypothetical protein K1W26_07975 [Acetatifactor sp.]